MLSTASISRLGLAPALAALALFCASDAAQAQAAATALGACEPLTGLQKAAGYLTLANSIKAAAALGAGIFTLIFFHSAFAKLAKLFFAIPKIIWKLCGWALSFAGLAAPLWAPLDMQGHFVFAGGLGAAVSAGVLFDDLDSFLGQSFRLKSFLASAVSLGLGALLMALSVMTDSSTSAALAAAGLCVGAGAGLLTILGKRQGNSVSAGLLSASSALLVAVALLLLERQGVGMQGAAQWDIASKTALWLCIVALLITATRWIGSRGGYWIAQGALLGVGVMLLLSGAWLGPVAQQAGGTMIAFYALIKPLDFPRGSLMMWSLSGLITCAGVYAMMRAVTLNPQFWGSWLMI